jgi:hypothetical protein
MKDNVIVSPENKCPLVIRVKSAVFWRVTSGVQGPEDPQIEHGNTLILSKRPFRRTRRER